MSDDAKKNIPVLTRETCIAAYNHLSDDVVAKRKQRDAVLKDWMLVYPREGQEFDTPEFRHACDALRSALNSLDLAVQAFEEIEAYSERMSF